MAYIEFQSVALPPDSYRDELWHLLFGLQIYISILSKQNFNLKIIKFLFCDHF